MEGKVYKDKKDMTFKEFSVMIRRADQPRSIRSYRYDSRASFGFYKRLVLYKNKHIDKQKYCKIIKDFNNAIAEKLLEGEKVVLPHKFGYVFIGRVSTYFDIVDDKIETNMAVDWLSTLKLWYEDDECHDNKTLVRWEEPWIYYARKPISKYMPKNLDFFKFRMSRERNRQLSDLIKNNKITVKYERNKRKKYHRQVT